VGDSKYYVQAIERALGLLRQGAARQAQNILQDAIDCKLEILPSDMTLESDKELELAIDLHVDDVPLCWIDPDQEDQIVIDDSGWDIDIYVLEILRLFVLSKSAEGMEADDVKNNATKFLRECIATGKIRRK